MEDNNLDNVKISLSEKSIREVIILLSDIDVKITALNDSSAQDFLNLNVNLKDNYHLSAAISANARELFDILSGDDRDYLLKELDTFSSGLKEQIGNFTHCVDEGATIVDKISSVLDILFIPIRNFSQNIMTLNFLLANLKLNVTYLKQEQMILNMSEELTERIKSVKEKYDTFYGKVSKLKALLDLVKSNFSQLQHQQTITLEAVLEQVQSSARVLSGRQNEASIQMPRLTQKTKSYFDNVSNIITNLQFHDIIRQKMEHVQITHKQIINEISNFDFKDQTAVLNGHTSKFLKIRHIAGVQVAQLIHTNQEYQSAIDKITKNFIEIGDDVESISEMCNSFSGFSNIFKGGKGFVSTEKNLETSVDLIKKFGNDSEFFISKIKSISGSILEIKDCLNEINGEFVVIKEDLSEICSALQSKEQTLPTTYKLGKQLDELGELIEQELNKLIDNFVMAENEVSSLKDMIGNDFETEFNHNLDKFSDSVVSVVNILNDDNARIEQILRKNIEIGTRLSMNIKSSIEQVQYYDFFEQIIEEIINELNSIHKVIKLDSLYNGENNAYDLEALKQRYTMESQRTIHDSVLGKGIDNLDLFEGGGDDDDEEDDDIEFF